MENMIKLTQIKIVKICAQQNIKKENDNGTGHQNKNIQNRNINKALLLTSIISVILSYFNGSVLIKIN